MPNRFNSNPESLLYPGPFSAATESPDYFSQTVNEGKALNPLTQWSYRSHLTVCLDRQAGKMYFSLLILIPEVGVTRGRG